MLAAQTALAATALVAGLTSTWSPCGFSMIETIGRAGGRGRTTRAAGCGTFAVGALAGGAATFGGLAAVGRAAHGAAGDAALAVAGAIALAAAIGEARGVHVLPQVRRQVPEPWRRVLPVPVAAALYGALLGLGFTTFVLTLGVWALAAVSFALADVPTGLAIGLAFGAGRALPVVAIAPLVDRPAGVRALELMAERAGLLRGFRAAGAVLLAGSALALSGAAARAADLLAVGAKDPTVAGGLVGWDAEIGGLLAREQGAPSDPHQLGSGGLLQLAGREPALGGSMLAYRDGGTITVVRASDLAPVADFPLPGATAFAVSDRWLAYRARRPGGGDRIAVRALASPLAERSVAAVRAPGQLGRPALAEDAVVFHVADRRSSRILEVDLVTGRRRVLRSSRLFQLTNPAVLGGSLLYVRRSNLEQRLELGPRRPGGRDRVLHRAPGTARRDGGFEPGHSTETLTPPARAPATRAFWTTALGPRYAYLSLVPPRGSLARATIVRVRR